MGDLGFTGIYYRAEHPFKTGTFFSHEGRLISNCHVVTDGDVFLKAANQKFEAAITHADHTRDLCLLEALDKDHPLDSVRWEVRPFQSLKEGETVYLLGNPLGLEGTFSSGMISSLRRLDNTRLVQVTAPSSPGSSGSPVFDEDGVLLGVLTSQVVGGQNLNFAVSVDHLQTIEKEEAIYDDFTDHALELSAWRTFGNENKEQWINNVDELLGKYTQFSDTSLAVEMKSQSLVADQRFSDAILFIESHERNQSIDNLTALELKIEALDGKWSRHMIDHTLREKPLDWDILDQFSDAISQYRKINPFNLELNAKLAEALSDMGEENNALGVLEDSNAINPDHHKTLEVYGTIHRSLENWEQSLDYCERAVEQWDKNMDAWTCILMAARVLGKNKVKSRAVNKIQALRSDM